MLFFLDYKVFQSIIMASARVKTFQDSEFQDTSNGCNRTVNTGQVQFLFFSSNFELIFS